MATVNLGRIKPVFRGAYNNSTAYVVDDIVTQSDETFICIQASTGNATSNASYWTKLAAKGADGTDVGTTLTTQGDILYRDGSGLQRLAKGTSGNVLKQGTNHPEWGTVSGGVLSVNFNSYNGTSTSNVGDGSWQELGAVNSAFIPYRIDVTPQSASSRFLIKATVSAEFDQYGGITIGRQINGTGTIANLVGSGKHVFGNGTGDPYHNAYVQARDYPNTTSPVNYRIHVRANNGENVKVNQISQYNTYRHGITLEVIELSSDVASWTFNGTGDTL